MSHAHTPAEFSIPVAQLEGTGDEHVFSVRPAWVRGVLEAGEESPALRPHQRRAVEAQPTGKDGELRVRLTRSGHDVVVQGRLATDLTLPCARCLEPFTFHVDKPLSVLMVPAATLKSQTTTGEYELQADEADVLPYDGEVVVLDDLVHDELVLEIPMIPLCSEDCPGIRPPPGSRPPLDKPAVDPRLAPLAKLKGIVPKSGKPD
jgi:uncharacterized protein